MKIADRHTLRVQEDLWADSLQMAAIVEAAFALSVRALCDGRPELAAEVKEHEKDIDRREMAIENECLRVLALYEPVACDLRRVLTILRINRDLERVGDLAARIAKRVRRMAKDNEPPRSPAAPGKPSRWGPRTPSTTPLTPCSGPMPRQPGQSCPGDRQIDNGTRPF